MYGSKFADMWRGADIGSVKAIWAEEMGRLTNDELKRGYAGLMARDWPPSLPEYVKMCKPSIDPMVAYYEAVAGVQQRQVGKVGVWSHPAIFWAAMPLAFDLSNQTYSMVKIRWERALHEQMERGEWAEIPEPMIALPEPGKSFLSREKAAAMLKSLDAEKIIKDDGMNMDHKLWAKRIMEREKRGDKELSCLQVRFAREAMSVSAT